MAYEPLKTPVFIGLGRIAYLVIKYSVPPSSNYITGRERGSAMHRHRRRRIQFLPSFIWNNPKEWVLPMMVFGTVTIALLLVILTAIIDYLNPNAYERSQQQPLTYYQAAELGICDGVGWSNTDQYCTNDGAGRFIFFWLRGRWVIYEKTWFGWWPKRITPYWWSCMLHFSWRC